ncbi:hypothetical protein NEOLI_001587 [Neolecta irregularis DAH-3]|uniref:Uncharacterized protein n=1 Tax=Neolecta irregularis (strain DAH-3) TaxID=1198029 RepID=A0A1U7LNZ4_NEOID|nr:hypothetical protein NEOLI_001587 [Neolecta irregularis DAH-3]|eukprot:OLL24390.1 hypothetical protein NEOLI_001587 [Neolecta irregularis DAH-3]
MIKVRNLSNAMLLRTSDRLSMSVYPVLRSVLSHRGTHSTMKPIKNHLHAPVEQSQKSTDPSGRPLIRQHNLFRLHLPHLKRKIQVDLLSKSSPPNSLVVEALEALTTSQIAPLKTPKTLGKHHHSSTSKLLGLSEPEEESHLDIGTRIVRHAGIKTPLALFSYLMLAKMFKSPASVLIGLNLYMAQPHKHSPLTKSPVIPHPSAVIALQTTTTVGDLEATEKVIDLCYASDAVRQYNTARAILTALIPVSGLLLAGKGISYLLVYAGIELNQSIYPILLGLGTWCFLCISWFYIWFIISRSRTGLVRFVEGTGILRRITYENERQAWEVAMIRQPNWKSSKVVHEKLEERGFQFVKPEKEFVPLTADNKF